MPHILVVDDDAIVSRSMRFWFGRDGHSVVIANGAEDGVEALGCERFDIMIIDIFMPHMDGFESIRRFHAAAPGVPLIALSGYAFAESHSPAPDFMRMALAFGASRCIRKPFKPRELLAVITGCLSGPQIPPPVDSLAQASMRTLQHFRLDE